MQIIFIISCAQNIIVRYIWFVAVEATSMATCKHCDDTGWIIRQLFDARSLVGFRQDAVRCECRTTGIVPRLQPDRKMAAANDDSAHDTSYMSEATQ